MHDRKWEIDGQFGYQVCWLLAMADQLKVHNRLSCTNSRIVATLEALGDQQPALHLCGVIVFVLPAAGDNKGDWDFGES